MNGRADVKSNEGKYYFFDPDIVSRTEKAALVQGQVEKIFTNASWVDRYNWTPASGIPDWEQQVSIMYPNVEYDEENKKYRIWYQALHRDSPVDDYRWRDNLIDKNNSKGVDLGGFVNTARGVIHEGHDALCYMESDDGISWVRPELGEFYYKTREGKIIGTNIAYIGMHGLGVRKNANPDPGEPRYLMAGRAWDTDSLDSKGEPIGVAISYSEDGFHWEDPITIKTAYDCAPDLYYVRADTHNQLLFSTERNKYVVITRGYRNDVADMRVVAYMESTDTLTSLRLLKKEKYAAGEKYWERMAGYWSTPEIVLDRNVTADAQPYSMPVAHLTDGYYVGIVSMANFEREGKGVWNSVHAELTWSPDAKNWQYIDKGAPFIANTQEFALTKGNDYGMIYCAAPIDVDGKTKVFYSATPELHYINYGDIPGEIKKTVDKEIPKAAEAKSVTRTSALNIAEIRRDGYAGFFAEDGSVTTTEFIISGGKLLVTAEISERGSLKIEALDSTGNVYRGYEAEAFSPITESVTEKAVSWGGKDLSALKGMTVSFRILLKNAGVYTIGGSLKGGSSRACSVFEEFSVPEQNDV